MNDVTTYRQLESCCLSASTIQRHVYLPALMLFKSPIRVGFGRAPIEAKLCSQDQRREEMAKAGYL